MTKSISKLFSEHSFVIKILITGLFFAILFLKIDLSEIFATFLVINPIYFIVCLLIVPILYIIRVYTWKLLLSSVEINENFNSLLKIQLIGVFYGLITPGKIGELGRIVHLDHPKAQTVPTVFIEKILDVIGLLCICLAISVIIFRSEFEFFLLICIISLFSLAIFFAISNKRLILFFFNILKIDPKKIDLYLFSLNTIYCNKIVIIKCLFLTIIYYVFSLIIGYFLALSLSLDPIVIFTVPLLILIGSIPITIGGLGLRESVSVLLFNLLGLPAAYGVTYSLLRWIIIIIIPGFFGYYYTIKWHPRV